MLFIWSVSWYTLMMMMMMVHFSRTVMMLGCPADHSVLATTCLAFPPSPVVMFMVYRGLLMPMCTLAP